MGVDVDSFTAQELKTLAGCCHREGKFLRDVEEAGIPTAVQQSTCAALRMKCLEMASAMEKADSVKERDPLADTLGEG